MTEAEEAARAFGGTPPRLIRNRENAVYDVVLPSGRAEMRGPFRLEPQFDGGFHLVHILPARAG